MYGSSVVEARTGLSGHSGSGDSQTGGHFIVEKALSGKIGLNPFAVNDELWDGALAGTLDDFVSRTGGGFDVNVGEGDIVLREEALGGTAVGAPGSGIDDEFHSCIF